MLNKEKQLSWVRKIVNDLLRHCKLHIFVDTNFTLNTYEKKSNRNTTIHKT